MNKQINYEIELIINKKLYDSNKIPKKIYKKVNDKIYKLKDKITKTK